MHIWHTSGTQKKLFSFKNNSSPKIHTSTDSNNHRANTLTSGNLFVGDNMLLCDVNAVCQYDPLDSDVDGKKVLPDRLTFLDTSLDKTPFQVHSRNIVGIANNGQLLVLNKDLESDVILLPVYNPSTSARVLCDALPFTFTDIDGQEHAQQVAFRYISAPRQNENVSALVGAIVDASTGLSQNELFLLTFSESSKSPFSDTICRTSVDYIDRIRLSNAIQNLDLIRLTGVTLQDTSPPSD